MQRAPRGKSCQKPRHDMQTAPVQEATPGREACGGGGSGGMLGGGPTERGEEPRARRRSSKRLLETGNPTLHPEPRRGSGSEGAALGQLRRGTGCSPRGEPSSQAGSQHDLPRRQGKPSASPTQTHRISATSGTERCCAAAGGIQITKKKQSGLQNPA